MGQHLHLHHSQHLPFHLQYGKDRYEQLEEEERFPLHLSLLLLAHHVEDPPEPYEEEEVDEDVVVVVMVVPVAVHPAAAAALTAAAVAAAAAPAVAVGVAMDHDEVHPRVVLDVVIVKKTCCETLRL